MADGVELLLPVNRDLPFAGDPHTPSRLVSSAGGYLSNAVGCSPTTAVSPRSHSPLEDCPGSVQPASTVATIPQSLFREVFQKLTLRSSAGARLAFQLRLRFHPRRIAAPPATAKKLLALRKSRLFPPAHLLLSSGRGSANAMDSGNAQSWSGMDTTADQDFGNLIDFNNFDDLDLPDFNNIAYSHGGTQHGSMADALDQQHLDHQFPPQIPQHHGDGATGTQLAQTHNLSQSNMNANFFDYTMSQFSQGGTPVFSQAPDQVFRPHHGVPPTPNSVEMHGDPHRYMQQMDQQALYDQRYRMRKDDAVRWSVNAIARPH